MSKRTQPTASLSLDLDNKWSYMKTHGDEGWQAFPTYLDLVVPRFLDFLQERQLSVTVFIVGQDAALEKNQAALASISAAGHEIGNHSFHHEPWLHLYSREELISELARTEDILEQVTGQRPIGFRGPGYSQSPELIRVLAERGYTYDASTLPTFIGPLARLYYFFTAHLNRAQKKERKKLFGTIADGFRPLKAYRWKAPNDSMIEIPVTTMPIFRVPFHFSYLLYLRTFSSVLPMVYFRLALAMCRMTGVEPSLLLHPLDFLGKDDVPDLSFFPGMSLTSEVKLELLSQAVAVLQQQFEVVPMGEHARRIAARIPGPQAVVRSSPTAVPVSL